MADAKPGVFGQYELISRIGRGGMGETWKARRRDVANAPVVVIKRILPEHASDAGFVASFVNEAHVTASLQHPAIAQVLDFGQASGEYFFVIEYVHGRTVDQLLDAAARRGLPTLPVPVACFIALEILDGLQYAHSRRGTDGRPLQIVHRDISPDNLLVGFDGSLKLVDFGVAKARLKGRENTQVGMVKGKWPFFSPEQAYARQLDGRSDLWAMGVVLYRMVCGCLPFEGEWTTAAPKITRGEYPPPGTLNPRLPTPVVGAIERALQVNLNKRFQSAANMATGLKTALEETAPGFDRELFRAFVNWAFDDQLERERVARRIPATAREQIAKWVSEAREAASEVSGLSPRPSSSAAHTAMTRGPSRESERPSNRLGVAIALGLFVGATVAGAVVYLSTRSEPRPVPSAIDPRSVAFGRIAALYRALENKRPSSATVSRARYLELGKLAATHDAMTDADYLEACAAFEASLRDLLEGKGEDARPVAFDAGLAIALPELDTVQLSGRRKLKVTLSGARHNVLPLVEERRGEEQIKLPAPKPIAAVPYAPTSFAVLADDSGKARKLFFVGRGQKASTPRATSIRFLDFHPFTVQHYDVPVTYGSAFVSDGELLDPMAMSFTGTGFEKKSPVAVVTRLDGHYLLINGLGPMRAVKLRVKSPPQGAAVIANCGAGTDFLTAEALSYSGVEACALAVVGLPTFQSPVDVEVEAEPGETNTLFDTVTLDLSAPRTVKLDFARHNLAAAAKAREPRRRWRGKLAVGVTISASGGSAFAAVTLEKATGQKKYLPLDLPHQEEIPEVVEVRYFDFHPFETISADPPNGSLREALSFGEPRPLPGVIMDRSHGHFVELDGVAGYKSLELSRSAGARGDQWGAVAHCDGQSKVIVDKPVRFDNPQRCAVALLGWTDALGTEQLFVSAKKK